VYLTIVGLALDPEIADQRLDAHVLVDVLWTVASPGDLVEHISARTGPRQLDVGVYLSADSQTGADRAAHDLLERATSIVPLLRGWDIRPPSTTDAPAHET
jgi:hypothetical protein